MWYEGASVGSASRRFLHSDHEGSIVAVSDSSGNVMNAGAAIDTYDEYGIPGAANQTLTQRFAYTGQIFIPELGLYHYKARAYSPILGRFMQTDPVGYEDQINLYAYVSDDPIDGRDPSGLSTIDIDIKRTSETKTATMGNLTAKSDALPGRTVSAKTLEPPKAPSTNVNGTSRVAAGTFKGQEKAAERKLADRVELAGKVEGSDGKLHENIQIHNGNTEVNSEGCVLVGKTASEAREAVYSSRPALSAMMSLIHDTAAIDAKSGQTTNIVITISDPVTKR